jgi:dTDP-glucose 4,6-dehydratase
MTRVLLTGANGFVGSHLLDLILAETGWDVVCPVTFQHCGDPFRLTMVRERHDEKTWNRVKVVTTDLSMPQTRHTMAQFKNVKYILNVASASHVDTSISDPVEFTRNNSGLMSTMLEIARHVQPEVFLHMSTDEVHGPAPKGVYFDEWAPHKPSNVYSATKSAQEALAQAYWRTFQLPIIITRSMNLISPYAQDSDKFLPRIINSLTRGEKLYIHGSSDRTESGTRHWIDTRDWARAWLFILKNLPPATYPTADELDVYHIVGRERSNLEIAQRMATIMELPLNYEIVDFHSSRPGHDLAYRMADTRLGKLGWSPQIDIDQTLGDIIDWAKANPEWYAVAP